MIVQDSEIIFEQPVNERVRTILRLEHLFAQLQHQRTDASVWGLRAAVATLTDILSLFSRNDLKNELCRELNDKHDALAQLAERPGIDAQMLNQTLEQLKGTADALQDLSSQQTSQALQDSELLLDIIKRSAIPGGTCGIDLPAFHRWLWAGDGQAEADLDNWSARIAPFENAIHLYLHLLRSSAGWEQHQAQDGVYLFNGEAKFHLIRVALAADSQCFAEISAGRQRFSLRFLHQPSALEKKSAATHSIDFKLSLCSL